MEWRPLITKFIKFGVVGASGKEKQMGVEYLKFILVSVVGLGINSGTLWVMSQLVPEWTGEGDPRFYLLWIVAVGVTTMWNFFGNMLFTFRKRQ